MRNWRGPVKHVFALALRRPELARQEADDELRAFVEARVEQLIAAGMNPGEARAEAIRRLGRSIEARVSLGDSGQRRSDRI